MRLLNNGQIAIGYNELVPKVLTKEAYDIARHRKRIETTCRGGRGRSVEVIYDTLSERYKCRVCKVLGDPAEILGLKSSGRELRPVEALPKKDMDTAMERYNLIKGCEDYVTLHSELGVTAAKEEFSEAHGVSFKTLARWEKILRDSGGNIESLAPIARRKEGALLTAEQRSLLINLYCNENKPRISSVYRTACKVWRSQGIGVPSAMQCRRFIDSWTEKHRDIVTYRREGAKALKDKCLPYVERDPDSIDYMDVWVSDGKVLNFQIAHPDTGKACRATMIGFMDMKSLRMMGFEIMVTENTMSVASALRNACINAGAVPRSIYIDNGRAFKNKFFNGRKDLKQDLDGLFSRLRPYGLEHIQYSKPYNAQTKTIERAWQVFDEFEKTMYTYVGDGVSNKPASLKRNELWHRGHRENMVAKNGLPTLWGAYEAVSAWVNEYNEMVSNGKYLDGHSPNDFANGRLADPDFRLNAITPAQLNFLMMYSKVRKVTRNGFKINGVSYYAPEFTAVVGCEYIVKYTPHDPDQVYVFNEDGTYWLTAKKYWGQGTHAMAALGSEEDRRKVARVAGIQKNIEQRVIALSRTIGTTPEDLLYLPEALDAERLTLAPEAVKTEENKRELKYY